MIRAEFYKVIHHRVPWVLLGISTLFVVAPSVFFLFRPPADAGSYREAALAVQLVIGSILAAVYGSWIVGNEYQQGTLRRVLATDARRARLLGAKLVVGVCTVVVGLAVVSAGGVFAAWLSAQLSGMSLDLDGLFRSLVSVSFPTMVTVLIGLGLSIVTRSSTYAIITTLGVMVIFGPLLSLVPRVGKYTPSALTSQLADRIEDPASVGELGHVTAGIGLALILGGLGVVCVGLFTRRDI